MASAAADTSDVELQSPITGAARWRSLSVAALVVGVALMSEHDAAAQDGSQWFTRIRLTPAVIVANNPLLTSETPADEQTRWTTKTTIEIGRQTDGSREWHHLYGLPSYGFGFSMTSLGDRADTGRPLDAYAFFSWPFVRLSERVQVTTDIGMGVSWNWKEFNQETGSSRTVLGTNVNATIDWGFYLRHLTTRRMSVYAGIDFTHRSNGGMRQPNGGINMIGPSVALRYNLAPEPAVSIREVPPFQPAWEFLAGGAVGRKNVIELREPAIRRDYGTLEGGVGLQRHFYRYGKAAIGADVAYDGARGARIDIVNGDQVPWRPSAGQRLSLGVYGGYEHVINRFGALVQAGYDVARGFDEPTRPRFYMRYGWRYYLGQRFWGLFAIRSIQGRKADFLEFGAGYKLRWQ